MTLFRRAAVGVKWTSLSAGILGVLQVAQLLIMARLLDPTDFGLIALAAVVMQAGGTLANAGISNALIYKQEADPDRLSTLYVLTAALGLVLFLAVLTCAGIIAELFREPKLGPVLRWSALALLFSPFGQQFAVLLQKEMDFSTLARIEIATAGLGLLLAVVAALAGAGVYALVFAALAGNVLRTVWLVRIGWRRWPPRLHFRLRDLRGYWRFGAFQWAEQLLGLLTTNLDKILVGGLLGSHALGIYNVAYRLMSVPYALFNAVVTRVAFPAFAEIQNDPARVRNAFVDLVRITAIVMLPVYFGLFVTADQLFALLGPQWHGASPLLRAFAVLGMFYSIGSPFGSLLIALGRADISFAMNVLRLTLFTVAVPIGILFGAVGAAWAVTLAIALVMFPIGIWIRWRLIRLPMRPYFDAILRAATAGAIMAWAVQHLQATQSDSWIPAAQLGASVALGLIAYVLLISIIEGRTLFALLRRIRAHKERARKAIPGTGTLAN
ncbi:MOP flippase family protein [Thiohalocapsa sp. ML1]|uniref:MOP flippase family protein n=1 Tax=Thiohalocapsa sp. ML1 TaxID=1431688 RepID=UPI0007323025|nr:MOP flippase family protein [Thiohalocapsa sp. ML1]